MDIFSNPFYILGAMPQDDIPHLEALAMEKSAWMDPEIVSDAYNILINPQKRLSAELRWFPAITRAQIAPVLELCVNKENNKSPFAFSLPRLKNIAAMTLRIYTLPLPGYKDAMQAEYSILGISRLFEMLDLDLLALDIEHDRVCAGLPFNVDSSLLKLELESYRQEIVEALSLLLSKLPSSENAEVITFLRE
ncbi:MAG: hypothetical protein RR728_04950, partial [Oscillospiraceae bacterium]